MALYIIIGIPVFFFVLLTFAARFEKRMVWPYGKPESQPQFPDLSGYTAHRINEAIRAGFTFFGWSSDLKGERYRVSYALLCSPERDSFVIIGAGTILSMPLRGTWIYTPTVNGKVYYTTDNQSCVEIDVARRWLSQLAPARTVPALLARHKDLLRIHGAAAQPFAAGREAEEFRKIREEQYQAMSRQGYIAFTDASAVYWRYTFWGALKLAALNYSIGLLRGITGGRIPRSA